MGEDKIEMAEEIEHFSHKHDLKITDELLTNNETCDGCMYPIFPPFYTCAPCGFFLHKSCVELPRKSDTHFTPTSSPSSQSRLMLWATALVVFVVGSVMASFTIVRNANLMQMFDVV